MPPYQFLNLNKLPEAAFEALLWSKDRGSIVFLFLPKEGINRMQERLQFAQDEEISREWLGSESKKKPNNFPPKWHKFVEQELLVLITGFLNRVALTRCIVSETGHQMILFNIAPSYQVNSLGIRLLVRQSVSGIVGGQKFCRRSHIESTFNRLERKIYQFSIPFLLLLVACYSVVAIILFAQLINGKIHFSH